MQKKQITSYLMTLATRLMAMWDLAVLRAETTPKQLHLDSAY